MVQRLTGRLCPVRIPSIDRSAIPRSNAGRGGATDHQGWGNRRDSGARSSVRPDFDYMARQRACTALSPDPIELPDALQGALPHLSLSRVPCSQSGPQVCD